MIDWLIQSIDAHPDLAHGVAPDGLLSAAEQRRLAGFSVAKRRRDWLLGRWTAKQLVQSYVKQHTGAQIPLTAITIASDPDGAPRVIADCRLQIADCAWDLQSTICNLQLSISHSHGHAFCAISDQAGLAIGADIERIEPRAPEFAADYFTAPELARLAATPASDRDTAVTLIWSAKEAALKALRLGLTVDTRSVSCAPLQEYHHGIAWAPLGVACAHAKPHTLHGWWRVIGEYVLTLALAQAP